MTRSGTHLGVFAKFWSPGGAKTRLAAEIGDDEAAALYRAFVETTLKRLTGLAGRQELCCWPPDREMDFRKVVPDTWELSFQIEGDLGSRIEAFFEHAFKTGSRQVVLIGSDTPSIPIDVIRRAFDSLRRVPVVLGPSRDGGYYLVGASQKTPPIFRDIAWSTAGVWAQTVAALASNSLNEGGGYELMPSFSDVDTLDDLHALRRELASLRPSEPPLSRLALAIEEVFGKQLEVR
jgi:rSAM/selenodomain-associated transferase 1